MCATASCAQLIQARKTMPFRDLRDLLARIPLRDKEIKHLIHCGALDGMGENRMTMLHHAERISRSGNARQLAFDFTDQVYAAHRLRQQLEWENNACGYPFTALTAIFEALHHAGNAGERALRLDQFQQQPGRPRWSFAARLPGRSGGGSIYLWDGSTWVLAKLNKALKNPAVWTPLKVGGRWSRDTWGLEWLQVEAIQELNDSLELESPATF